jgi:hypothetical protein
MPFARRLLPMLAGCAVLFAFATAVPGSAHAVEPAASMELVLGAQDVPGAIFAGADARLALRLDRTAPVSPYGWIGVDAAFFGPSEGDFAHGHGFDAALGGDARACTTSGLCAGLRLAGGAQYATYQHGNADIGPDPHGTSTSAFVQLQPYVSFGHGSLGVDLRVHRLLDPPRYEDDLVRYGAGVAFGYSF